MDHTTTSNQHLFFLSLLCKCHTHKLFLFFSFHLSLSSYVPLLRPFEIVGVLYLYMLLKQRNLNIDFFYHCRKQCASQMLNTILLVFFISTGTRVFSSPTDVFNRKRSRDLTTCLIESGHVLAYNSLSLQSEQSD